MSYDYMDDFNDVSIQVYNKNFYPTGFNDFVENIESRLKPPRLTGCSML